MVPAIVADAGNLQVPAIAKTPAPTGETGAVMSRLSRESTSSRRSWMLVNRRSSGVISDWRNMRSRMAISPLRSLCAAACFALLAPQAQAFGSNKPLTEYTHTVWTHRDASHRPSFTRLRRLGTVTFGSPPRTDLSGLTASALSTGVPRRAVPSSWVLCSLCAGRDGSLWIGTAAGLVGHIRGDDLRTFSVGAQAEAILEDREGTLWVATESRVMRFRAVTQEPIGAAIALPGAFLSGPFQDRSGSIWISTKHAVLRLDPADPHTRLVSAAEGEFWLSEDTGGIIWMTSPDGSTQPTNEGHISSRAGMRTKALDIRTVLHDSQGNTWIGTGQGLARLQMPSLNRQKLETFAQSDGLSAQSVWCLLEDRENNIWVGTENGLNRFRDEKVTTLTRREGLPSDNVNALAAGTDGAIWASTPIGIDRIDGQDRDLYLNGIRVSGLFVDRHNTLWAGTNRGVARLERWRYLSMPTGTRLTNVTVITEDGANGVWLFDSERGLYRCANGRITDYSQEPLLKGKSIQAAQADASGRVWFGLYEGGVVVFDGTRFHAYSEADGLTGGSVNTVYLDDQSTRLDCIGAWAKPA